MVIGSYHFAAGGGLRSSLGSFSREMNRSSSEILSRTKRLQPDRSALPTSKRRRRFKRDPEQQEKTEAEAEVDPLSLLSFCTEPWRSPPQQNFGRGSFRLGTSGYIYKHWKGVVYPQDASQKDWFRLYTHLFDTVEINNTFYRLPEAQVFQSWHDQAPRGFCYALKYSRYGTHMKRLKDPEGHVSLFLDRSAPLSSFCGPILVQLPPKFNLDVERLKQFLDRLPHDFRWAVEVRDSRWLCDEIYELLKQHKVALCIHDHEDLKQTIYPKVITANWLYLRFHGKNYKHLYTAQELEESAAWIRDQLEKGLDVFAYFNNDACGYAVTNALALRKLVLQ